MLDALNRIMYRYDFESQWALARLAGALVNADNSVLHLASDVNYLLWLRQYFRAANRRGQRLELREVADSSVIFLESVLQLPGTLSADSVAQQEVLRRHARVFQASTTKTGYFLATIYAFLATGLLLLGALLGCAFLAQHHDSALEPVLGPQLTALVRAVPPFGPWAWVGALLLVAYLHRRMVVMKRGCLQRDTIRRPAAGPAL
jgi:hypothetical protein